MDTRKDSPTAFCTVMFILNEDPSIESFYNFITNNGTVFDYDINCPSSVNDWTPLHVACKSENIPLVRALINMGVYINPTRQSGGSQTPLDDAVKTQNQQLIKLLEDHGAVRAEKWYDHEKFRVAFKENNVKAVNEILEKNPSLNSNFIFMGDDLFHFVTPTRSAAESGNLEMVKLLTSYGGRVTEYRDGISTPMAARSKGHDSVADYLEHIQNKRFFALKAEVFSEQYNKTSRIGVFADKNTDSSKESESSQDFSPTPSLKRSASF